MSESTIRAKIVTVLEGAGAVNVYGAAVRIANDTDAINNFGNGEDSEGLALLDGWWIPPAESNSKRLSRGITHWTHAFSVMGYKTRVDGAEADAETLAKTMQSALTERTAFASLSPTPLVIETRATVSPAFLAGYPVWETVIAAEVIEYECD